MARLSARSNPTGIRDIEKGRVGISVLRSGNEFAFALDRLDLSNLPIAAENRVLVIARAGNTTSRHELGTAGAIVRTRQSLDGLSRSHPLWFRVLIHEENDPRFIASAENIRPRDESQGESLLPMEPADLGERLWRLRITNQGPVLQFNSRVFPNAAGAEGNAAFRSLVLPEALSHVLRHIANNPDCISDEANPFYVWKRWLDAMGTEALPDSDEDENDAQIEAWCEDVVDRFCAQHQFATALQADLFAGVSSD